jgi:hypothetical protein
VEQTSGFGKRLWAGLVAFFEHPVAAIVAAVRWAWRAVPQAINAVFRWLGKTIIAVPRSRSVHVVLGLAVVVCVAYAALFSWIDGQVPKPEPVDEYVYQNQGWGDSGTSPDRMTYYYSPQGAHIRDIRYDWFVNLERPWKTNRFAESQYMRGYGFIVDPSATDKNPDNLPIGFAREWDAKSASMMLDLTCAACHTGELQVVKNNKRIAMRIDGGQGMHDVTSVKMGSFGSDVMFSLIATVTNPAKWTRFSSRVLGDDHSFGQGFELWMDVNKVIYGIARQAMLEKRLHLYPTEEGYGRTDALGRIANNVFGTNLDERNYRPANAPVSYPPVWNAWKFDWVQYTASVAQPLARNIGEALGTGAQYYLVDRYGKPVDESQRYRTSVYVPHLIHLEETLQSLKAPEWNEDLFGAKDQKRYDAGKLLFKQYCYGCHGPFYASCSQKQIEAPLKASSELHWKLTTIPLQEIGTDPNSAMNFVNNRYDLSSTGIPVSDLRRVLGLYYKEQFRRIKEFGTDDDKQALTGKTEDSYAQEKLSGIDLSHVTNGEGLNYIIALIRERAYEDMDIDNNLYQRMVRDGFGQLDTPQQMAQYRARPLEGMWATAPFLHNGSVPNLYELLLPANQRSKTFYMKGRTFDPVKVGLVTNPTDPAAFLFDTTKDGNSNAGHEFRAGYRPYKEGNPPAYGVIGPELKEEERWSIIEYLKFMKDSDFATKPADPCGPSQRDAKSIQLSHALDQNAGPPPPPMATAATPAAVLAIQGAAINKANVKGAVK